MPHAHNIKAAELHETAAKSHRMAADLHTKKQDKTGNEHAEKALVESTEAHKASVAPSTRSVAAPAKN